MVHGPCCFQGISPYLKITMKRNQNEARCLRLPHPPASVCIQAVSDVTGQQMSWLSLPQMLTPYNLLGLIRVTLQASFDYWCNHCKSWWEKVSEFVPSKYVSLEIQKIKETTKVNLARKPTLLRLEVWYWNSQMPITSWKSRSISFRPLGSWLRIEKSHS